MGNAVLHAGGTPSDIGTCRAGSVITGDARYLAIKPWHYPPSSSENMSSAALAAISRIWTSSARTWRSFAIHSL